MTYEIQIKILILLMKYEIDALCLQSTHFLSQIVTKTIWRTKHVKWNGNQIAIWQNTGYARQSFSIISFFCVRGHFYITKGHRGGWVVQKMAILPYFMLWKYSYVGGWVVQKSLKTPLCNIKMAPNCNVNL